MQCKQNANSNSFLKIFFHNTGQQIVINIVIQKLQHIQYML